MAITNASRLADFGSGIGTEGAIIQVDNTNARLGIGTTNPQAMLQVGTGVSVYGNSGIVSATEFYGDGSNLSGITAGATLSAGSGAQRVVVTSLTSGTMTAAATDADLSWNSSTNTLSAPTLSGNITGTSATFTGNVSIGGTLTYEDVTNIDSVGVITSRDGIRVGASQSISPVSGTITYYGDGSNLDGVESGVVNFVASGTIPNGATVVINTDGTVGIVTQTTSSTPSAGTPVKVDTSSYSSPPEHNACVYDSTNKKVVIAYKDADNSYYGTAVVGTVSGTSISFGTPVDIDSTYMQYISTAYDSTNGKVVIAYRDYGNSNYGTARVGTVSGTSISFGTAAVFESASTDYTGVAFDSTNGKVVIAYTDSGNSDYGTAIVGTVSGTNISFGTPAVFESAASYNSSPVYDPDNGKVVIFYNDNGNSFYGTAIVGTVSGTAISFGTPAVFREANTQHQSCSYDSTNQKVVIAYQGPSSGGRGEAVVGTVSGTGITFGSVSEYGPSNEIEGVVSSYDSTNGTIVVFYNDNGAAGGTNGQVVTGTVSGTSISFGSPTVFYSASSHAGATNGIPYYKASTFDSTKDKVIVAYAGGYSPSYVTASVIISQSQSTNLTTENYIGIAGEAISNAATGKVNVIGGTNTGQSGLTTNRKYYVQADGTLATTADTPSVVAGTSISDTKILVWKS